MSMSKPGMPVGAAPSRRARFAAVSGIAGGFTRRLLAAAGSRLALACVVVLALGWLVSGPLTAVRRARETPFRVDYVAFDTAASIVWQGDAARLYDPDLQRSVQADRTGSRDQPYYFVFANPPVVALPFVPLTLVSARAAYLAEVSLLSAMMIVVSVMVFLALGDAPRVTRALAAIGVFGSTATASALLSGQLTPILLLAAIGCLLLHQRGRPGAAGVVLGVIFIKPHLGVAAVVILLVLGQRKVVLGALSTMCLLAAGSWLTAGNAGIEGYIRLLRRAYAHPASLDVDVRIEQNLRGLLASVFHIYDSAFISPLSVAVALLAMIAVIIAARRAAYTGADRGHYVAALAAAFTCVAVPHIQYYDLGLLVFPVLFLVRRAGQVTPAGRRYVLGVIVLTVAWLEAAGLLAGVKASVSFVPLVALMGVLVEWPAIERWIVRMPEISRADRHRRMTDMAA